MGTTMLGADEKTLLETILAKHSPSLLCFIETIGVSQLTDEHRELLREAISDELLESGLDEKDEPNQHGLMMEQLIDRLGHL